MTMHTERRSFLDIDFDTITLDSIAKRLGAITSESPFGYIVTPNVDHVVRLHQSGRQIIGLANAYRGADLCVCDSRVLSLLGALCGVNLPVAAGSDLTVLLFERVIRDGDRIAIVGGDLRMVDSLRRLFPRLDIVHHCPPMGLACNPAARRDAAEFVAEQKARFSFICVGSPQQELIAAEVSTIEGSRGFGLCVGASLEFITGHQRRAPLPIQRIRCEWAYRLCTNPRRLWRRYLVEGPRIFLLTYQWSRRHA